MRLLANENVPRLAVEALRTAGHDIVWVRTEAPGSPDEDVLLWAAREGRILLSFDKDFGELVFKLKMAPPPGIILFRFAPTSPATVARIAVEALHSRNDWEGKFAVVEEARVRITPLPPRVQ